MVYELEGLPPEFEAAYRRKMAAIYARLDEILPELDAGHDKALTREARRLNREAKRLKRKAKSEKRKAKSEKSN